MSDFKSVIIENIIRERDKEREREKIKKYEKIMAHHLYLAICL